MSACRFDRDAKTHLTREHMATCVSTHCKGCKPCTRDDEGTPVRHCRVRVRCTSHLGWTEHACPVCLSKIRTNLTRLIETLALMPDEAEEQGVNSEAANLAGPHADYVRASWRLINADRAGEVVEELDMSDPYTCLTMHERTVREDLGHDDTTLVSASIAGAAGYLSWVLTDLARDESHAEILASLLADSSRLLALAESARSNSTTPERGVPCPAHVDAQHQERARLEAEGVDEAQWPKLDAPRLVRHHGHWCKRDGCERLHYLDDSGDVWRCPVDSSHEWSHADYEARLTERRATRHRA